MTRTKAAKNSPITICRGEMVAFGNFISRSIYSKGFPIFTNLARRSHHVLFIFGNYSQIWGAGRQADQAMQSAPDFNLKPHVLGDLKGLLFRAGCSQFYCENTIIVYQLLSTTLGEQIVFRRAIKREKTFAIPSK